MSGETWKNELKEHFEAFKLIENAKEDLIRDILERYRNFAFSALASPV